MATSAFLVLLLISTALAQNTFWSDSFQLGFNYDLESATGPNSWDTISVSGSEWSQFGSLSTNGNACGRVLSPSPIPLITNDVCTDTVEIQTRQISDLDCKIDSVSFELTPASLKAYFPADDSTCERPTIELDGFTDPFVLAWLELHARAEHVIDGRRFDAELQMVHIGTGNNVADVATVSILIDASARQDHEGFQTLLDGWTQAADSQEQRCGTRRLRPQPSAIIRSSKEKTSARDKDHRQTQTCTGSDCGPRIRMFPYYLWPRIYYFSYNGGLTAPPCSFIVNWRIIDQPLQISRRQYKEMTRLLTAYKDSTCLDDSVASPQGENFRPLQEINSNGRQTIVHCTADDFEATLFSAANQ